MNQGVAESDFILRPLDFSYKSSSALLRRGRE